MSNAPETDRSALEEERDLLRESLIQTLTALRDLEQEMARLHHTSAQQRRNQADRHLLKAMNELLELQIETQKDRHHRREDVLGRIMLDDATVIRAQAQQIEALRNELDIMQNSRSWKITAPLRSSRGTGKR